jgi:indolepyruvate ferredoxin oxidoreductase
LHRPAPTSFDGVFGIWYGKGPGVDRCSDVFKHANMAGTTPWGGVIAVAGDDHISEKLHRRAPERPHLQGLRFSGVLSRPACRKSWIWACMRLAMSRFSGVWAGMKTIQEIVESSATAEIDPERVQIVLPDFPMPPGGLHIRWPDHRAGSGSPPV